MALKLDKLGDAHSLKANEPSRPYELVLSNIYEDTNQPRQDFESEALSELIASVSERGIKSPISVHKHPTQAGKWIINHGARRFRAAQAAGLKTIPAFIDENHTDFDQVIENLHRDNLKPIEMAAFIGAKLKSNMKGKDIAKSLGVTEAFITYHQVLIDPDPFIEQIYRSGKCQDMQTLYQLRKLSNSYPDAVQLWAADQIEITRSSVKKFSDDLKSPKRAEDAPSLDTREQFAPATIPVDKSRASMESDDAVTAYSSTGPEDKDKDFSEEAANADNSEGSNGLESKRIKNPKVSVSYGGQAATLILTRRPSVVGLMWIVLDKTREEHEVSGKTLQFISLTEG